MEQLGLERQHHRQPIRAIDKLVDSAAPPCPDLRRDVIQHRHARAPGSAGENQVELGIVYQDHEVGLLAPDDSPQDAKCADRASDRRGEFGESEPVDIFHPDDRSHARRAHLLARHAEQFATGTPRRDLAGQISAMKIARRLAGNDHDSAPARSLVRALTKRWRRFGIQGHRSDCD